MKAENPYVKSALMKATMAEQEETSRNFKRAFDLYKEAVEMLIPIAEGMDGCIICYLLDYYRLSM